jgi:hypothetical protein
MIPEALNPLSVPKRSRLYHLEPIAISTPYVEGLISYICRLAEAHCVSPGVLIKKEILPSFRKNYSISTGDVYAVQEDGNGILVSSIPKPVYRQNSNEYGLLAWQYLEGLKTLTLREDLQALVIPPTANRILVGMTEHELGRNLRAWCPECFQTWRTTSYPVYEPLLWSIAVVNVCPIHHKPLQFHCPHCQKAQRHFTARMCSGRCSQCSGWLDVRLEKTLETKLLTATELEKQLRLAEQAIKSLNLL